MPPFQDLLVLTLGALAALGMIAGVWMWSWRQWLNLRRLELVQDRALGQPTPAGNRIELADLKERVRKLEAIAAGVDL